MPKNHIGSNKKKQKKPGSGEDAGEGLMSAVKETLDNPSEKAFGELVVQLNKAQLGCTELANDGRLTTDKQAGYWALSTTCLATLWRVNDVWTKVVDKVPLEDIRLHAALSALAADAVRLAIKEPKTINLLEGLSKTGLANDQISALFDRTSPT